MSVTVHDLCLFCLDGGPVMDLTPFQGVPFL